MGNTSISLQNLDPNTIKKQMITWFQSNTIFQDWNFGGSNLNVLVDVLSRNDFLLAFYLNMTFAEMFNDSAQLRDSLVSKAKELNYVPYSMKSSTTSLTLTMNATNNVTILEMPKGTIFTGRNSNSTFSYVTDQNYISTSTNGFFTFANVNIYEGFYQNDLFAVDATVNNQLFTFSSTNIDTSSLFILVSENAGATNTIFTQAQNLYGLNGNSTVYFLQAGYSNTYQFQFGDGVLGYIPQNGAIVTTNYRVTSGDAANYVQQFTLSSSLSLYNNTSVSNVYITPSGYSSGGSQNEGIDSIRFNNPRHYQTQDNAITAINYRNIVLENFPTIADVNVYGGSVTNTAVTFGMIFMSLVTTNGNPATAALKADIQSIVDDVDILNYQVSFVDPTFTYLGITTNVHVDFDLTNVSPPQYYSLVSNGCITFSTNNLETFNTNFRYSVFCDYIDGLDSSIISNETTVFMQTSANILFNTNTVINFSYNNPIVNVTSSQFIISGNTYYLTDVVNNVSNSGILYLVQPIVSNNSPSANAIGTVNYSTGQINIPVLNISGFPNNSSVLNFTVYPLNKDIYTQGNQILQLNPLLLNINIVDG